MPAISPEILKQVKAIELRSRGIVSSLFAGEYRSVFRGQGMEFAEVRQYEHGDDFRAIDWNVSARLGHPYIKTFIEEREVTLLLVVDQSGSTHFGTPRHQGRRWRWRWRRCWRWPRPTPTTGSARCCFRDKVERVIPPAKGRRHALRVIRDLVAFRPAGRRTNLAAALHYATELLQHRSIVVVLSDFLARGMGAAAAPAGVRHDVVAVAVEDPREASCPMPGGWIWRTPRPGPGGWWIPAIARCAAGCGRWPSGGGRSGRRAFAAAGVDQVVVSTRADYAPALRRAFAQRARRLHR